MKKFILSIIVILSTLFTVNAQYNLNDYKYVIVEKQFHFQNEENEYHLNRLVKFQFKKYGFNAIIEGEPLPDDLKANYCLALNSEVKAKGSLRTKVVITLTDCDNNLVFASQEGITKEKDYKRTYELGIRKAFESFADIGYSYIPNERVTSQGGTSKEEVAELKAELAELKKEKAEKEVETAKEKAEEMVEEKVSEVKETKPVETKLFYKAVSVDNGFELVPSKDGHKALQIYTSGMKDVYFVKGESGVIYQKDGNWGREFVKDGVTVFEPLDIRFQ